MDNITHEKFQKAETAARKFYEKNKIIKCPALGNIKVTPESMEHLKYKDKNHHRTIGDSYTRYRCFLSIKDILNNMHYYQEYKVDTKHFPERKNGKTVKVKRIVELMAFIAIVKIWYVQNRIKIVVAKNQWNYEFISVIPCWNSRWYSYFENKDLPE